MIFKLSSFLTLALALSSVTAFSVPRSVDSGQLSRRFSNVRITWFNEDGVMGDCGHVNVNPDFVVALPPDLYDNGAHCGASVIITYNGVSVVATVADKCKGCAGDDIDVTEGIFNALNVDLSLGVLYGDWNFV